MFISFNMGIKGRISEYNFRVQTEKEGVKVKLSDILRIDVSISVRYIDFVHSIKTSTLLKRSMFISYQNFIENNKRFLRSFMLCDPRCSHCFISEIVDVMSKQIVDKTKNIIEFCSDADSVDSECKELPLNLDIMLDVLPPPSLRTLCMQDFFYEDSDNFSSTF